LSESDEKASPSKLHGAELIKRIRARWDLMQTSDELENREHAAHDMRFLNVKGCQYDDHQRKERGDRPCYEFNELKVKVNRIRNQMRANPPEGKVRAVEDGDVETAETREGLLRNIWSVSKGNHITDYASGYQVGCGMGAWRVDTDYADESFDQDILFKPILNPLCLWWDPASKDQLKRDSQDWFYTERISKIEYEQRWPKAEVVSLDEGTRFDRDDDWRDESEVRIGEYWWKEPAEKTILLLSNGKTVDASKYDGSGFTIMKRRTIHCHKIMMCIVGGGDTILEKPTEWAGKYFPFVVVFGEYVIIEGRVYWWGLTRDGIDAQQGFNSAMTSIVETINQSPQSKFWATPEQAKGHLAKWAVAHKENLPFLLYNVDPKAPGPPSRMGSPDVPVAFIQVASMMRDNMKAVTGVFDASVGQTSNETSGVAITARQNQGEIANFHFQDNMALGIEWSWQIADDLVGKIYDAARSIRILGKDLAEKYVRVNDVQPNGKKLNDLTAGKYDLTVTVGPSWSTRRQEAVEVYSTMGQANPALWNVAGDLIFRAMDMPYAEEIAERMKAILPPQIQQTLQQGKEIPPEVQQAMQQAAMAMQQVEQQSQLVQAAAAEAEKGKTAAEKAALNVQSMLKDLEVKRAQFDGDVAKQLAAITSQQAALKVLEAQLETKVSQVEVQQQRDEFATESSHAAVNIQQMAQDFQQAASEIMQAMSQKEQELNGRINQEIAMLMQSTPPEAQQPVETQQMQAVEVDPMMDGQELSPMMQQQPQVAQQIIQ
jgi:hypothetical protein